MFGPAVVLVCGSLDPRQEPEFRAAWAKPMGQRCGLRCDICLRARLHGAVPFSWISCLYTGCHAGQCDDSILVLVASNTLPAGNAGSDSDDASQAEAQTAQSGWLIQGR